MGASFEALATQDSVVVRLSHVSVIFRFVGGYGTSVENHKKQQFLNKTKIQCLRIDIFLNYILIYILIFIH